MKQECGNCKFFDSWSEPDDVSKFGSCRRYPPQAVETFINDDGFSFPNMRTFDWCGEWKSVNIGRIGRKAA